MPTYDYECRECGHTFDMLQSMAEPKLTQCPNCKKDALARLIGSGSGVIFKGSGFYETDYKKKDAPKSDKPAASSCSSCPAASGGACPNA
jgi:putative FmdB family regulatory protein